MTTNYAVEAEGLAKSYGRTKALDGVSFSVPRGTVLGVLGPNGAGKTTAVRILSTLLKPDAGVARVAGFDVVKNPSEVRKRIGLTGQYASVDLALTGRENLTMIGELLNLRRSDVRARAAELLEWFNLTEAADRPAKTYSGGMRRRLDLAASLTGQPEIVFLDEPTTGLDPAKREDMWEVVRNIVDRGTSVLLTTQYLEEAEALADDIVVINHGRVIAHDTVSNLKRVVGSQSLHVRPTSLEDADAVRAILASVANDGFRVEETRKGEFAVPVSGDSVLSTVFAQLQRAGIPVTELSLLLPSLDEVFFTLTGEREAAAVNNTQEVSA
jgi:oleandomycin transport system ATP-binding protein